MEQNGLQKSLLEQLDALKKEQAEAERIYRGRVEMGALNSDPASVQVLAQTILDRKMKIEDIEAQIKPREQDTQDYEKEEESNVQPEYQETSLTEYHRNPIINWLQRMVAKMEQFSERLEQKMVMRKNRMPTEPKIAKTKWEEYQDIIDTDFSKEVQGVQQKTEHQIFVDKISGNGAYHTYGKNAQKMPELRAISDYEKMQKEDNSR